MTGPGIGDRARPTGPEAVDAVVVSLFRRRRRAPGASETVGQVIGVAIIGAVAGVGGERLYDRAPLALVAVLVAILSLLVLALRRHRKTS